MEALDVGKSREKFGPRQGFGRKREVSLIECGIESTGNS
jgi:hypothetical protein